MALQFITSNQRYSMYRDERGEVVNLAHGKVMRRMIAASEIPALYQAFQDADGYDPVLGYIDDSDWIDSIRELLLDENVLVEFCTDCDELAVGNDVHGVGRDSDHVCSSCFKNYDKCYDCENYFEDTTTTLSDDEVCERCRGYNWSFCESCNGYYPDNDGDSHLHDEGCGCESPEVTFAVPNAGELLDNDETVVVELPAGVISEEGLTAVQQLVWSAAYDAFDYDERRQLNSICPLVHQVGHDWQTKRGNYTKRLSREAHKQVGYKISPELLGKIGSVAREHSSTITELAVEVTRDLNQSAEEFGNEGSCWWESYASSRCALKSNGGFGLRSFTGLDGGWKRVSGRVWVMPLKLVHDGTYGPQLKPTFNATGADAYVVFNGYGDLGGYTGARVMAQMTGMTYRKLGFAGSPMYVNNSSGYLVASEDIAQSHGSSQLYLNLDEHSSLHRTESREIANVA